jgi:uncharacterized membrane protein
MSAAPGNEHAHIHAKTMHRYHEDAAKTCRLLVGVFTAVAVLDGWMFVTTEAVPFAFAAGLALAAIITGAIWFTHHGKQTAAWQDRLNVLEGGRRDRKIHAPHPFNSGQW